MVKRRTCRWIARSALGDRLSVPTADADLEQPTIESTIVRAHQHAAGARLADAGLMPREQAAPGAGLSTRVHAATDALSNPGRLLFGSNQRQKTLAATSWLTASGRKLQPYQRRLRRLVAADLKTNPFQREHAGKMNICLAALVERDHESGNTSDVPRLMPEPLVTRRDPGDFSRFLIRPVSMTRLLHALSGLAIMFGATGTLHAQSEPAPTCGPAIAASEHLSGLPPKVLGAIGIVESGRVDPRTGMAAPWPWTINVAGVGHMFDSAIDAIAAVQVAQAAGIQSIDVGCMQINLLHHPHAFATLQDAFNPITNVSYAASFLARLHEQTGSWGAAIAAYHSATPRLGLPYARTVALIWPLATRYGLSAPDPAASTRAALEAEIDPHDVLTPEFRAQLVDAALQRRRERTDREVVMPHADAHPAPPYLIGAFPRGLVAPPRDREGLSASDRSALEDEVDPRRVLTSGFRAEMVAAARARHADRTSHVGQEPQFMPSRSKVFSRRSGRLLAPDTGGLREHELPVPAKS